ncbi:MAG: transcriptional regulator NrdR [Candidatus Ratteibacteria bacterium]|jgi:transcriptional repressor NrdR
MKCPYCGFLNDKVVDSREREDGQQIRRRRECLKCGKRWTTYEEIEEKPLLVIKKDGREELFSREKLFNGIHKACHKRPVTTEQIFAMIEQIEQELRQGYEKKILSSEIGERLITRLHKLDEIAYVRYASVYRQFKDAEEFQQELEKIRRRMNESKGNNG